MKKDEQEKIFQVEWNDDEEKVEIYLNQPGIDYFIKILTELKKENVPESINLMTPSWGGDELTEKDKNRKLVHHLKLYKG